MASLKTVLCLEIWLNAWLITTAESKFHLKPEDLSEKNFVPKAENVCWFSLDFKTILTWTTKENPEYTFSVLYSSENGDWLECDDCSQVSETECDMTNYLRPFDRTYSADIQTEHVTMDYNYDPEELTHTYSPKFNPYRESNISAVKFTVEVKDEHAVTVNITDPLTSIHDQHGKQLSIRDVLKNDLKYKISYYKSGSTGKRDIISDSSVVEVSQLDTGESYCFMVTAFIPSRPKHTQQGVWSKQLCSQVDKNFLQELSVGAWVGVVFIVLTVVIIIVAVTVLCCRSHKQRNKDSYTTQSSAPI